MDYFLDKLQSIELKKRVIMIKKDKESKLNDHPANIQSERTDLQTHNERGFLQTSATKNKPIDKEEVKWGILKDESQQAAGNVPPRYNLNSTYTKPVTQNATSRGKGSMDQRQRLQMKAKEINYLGQLENMVAPEKTTERASSLAKDFQEQKAKNDTLIKDQLQRQNEKLLEKLKERQFNSFNRSIQRTGGSTLRKGSSKEIRSRALL